MRGLCKNIQFMVQHTKSDHDANLYKVRTLYAVGIAGNLLISLAHIAYAFAAYKTIDEPALWFFSGALAVMFNAALNFACIRDCTNVNFVICMAANAALVIFIVVLTIVTKEAHTVFVAIIIGCTTVVCYAYNRQMRKSKFIPAMRS